MDYILEIVRSPLVINIAGYFAVTLFLFLSAVHFYWTAGGKRGLHVTVPSLENKVTFTPPPVVTFVVGFGFLIGVFVYLGRMGYFLPLEPRPVYQWFPWIFGAIFIARIVGDYKFVGLFKKVKNTTFAYLDNVVYMPLSFMLCMCSWVIGLSPMP